MGLDHELWEKGIHSPLQTCAAQEACAGGGGPQDSSAWCLLPPLSPLTLGQA